MSQIFQLVRNLICMYRQILILFVLITSPVVAFCHPVSYQHALGVMTWNQPFMGDTWITYSFRPDAAVAARIMRFETPEGKMQYLAPQFDYLAKRWNETDYQANLYFYGGYGVMAADNTTRGAGLAGFEADAESRKYFISTKYEKMWADLGPDYYHAEARVGVAPYEAEFNEIASWFMIQYQYNPALIKKFSLTPLARVFYRNFLFEMGVSTDGDWMFNSMFHF